MTKLLALALVSSLAACAATSTQSTLDRDTTPRAKVQLDLAATSDATQPAFPAALAPEVPSVDRLAHTIRAALGSTATAELDLCVSPAGTVTKVELARSSSLPELDAALLHDARAWQFASMPGPDSVQSCRRATIAYRLP